jgi:hypothetical protein
VSASENKTIAQKFVEDIFNARKTEMVENYVTPDIVTMEWAKRLVVSRISNSG